MMRIGSVQVHSKEIDPGFLYLYTEGGSLDDQNLAYNIVKAKFASKGYLIAEYNIRPLRKTADWNDVQNKAIRLYNEGNVHLIRNGYNKVVAEVKGDDPSTEVKIEDHHRVYPPPAKPQQTYLVEITRDDPNSQALTQANCECAYEQFRYDRNLKFKKNPEGISPICSHILATLYASQATPLDEDIYAPTQYKENPQKPLFNEPQEPGIATYPEQTQEPPQEGLMPDLSPAAEPAMIPQPEPQEIPSQAPPFIHPQQQILIPPSRQELEDMVAQQPTSVPDNTPPDPRNPFRGQNTLSHIIYSAQEYNFQPGDIVRINQPTYAQKVRGAGYSTSGEWHEQGTDAGEWITIPRNSQAEVWQYDPQTNYIELHFALNGPAMSSYYATAFVDASIISPVNRQPRPTPFTQRR